MCMTLRRLRAWPRVVMVVVDLLTAVSNFACHFLDTDVAPS